MELNFQHHFYGATRKRFSINALLSCLFCIYILLTLLHYFQRANLKDGLSYFYFPTIMVGLLFFIIENGIYKIDKFSYKVIGIIGVLCLGLLLNFIVNGTRSLIGFTVSLAEILSNIGVALFLIRRPLARFVLPFVFLLFCYLVTYFTYSLFIKGIDPNQLFLLSSQNTVSWLFILYSAIFYIVVDKLSLTVPVLPAIITVFFSVVSYGRSGIISSFTLLFSILLLNFHRNWKNSKFYIVIAFFSILLTLIIVNVPNTGNIVHDFGGYFTRLQVKGLSDEMGREYIWRSYFHRMNVTRFLFGVNPKSDPSVVFFDYNYHNSWIQLHANFGVVSIVFMFLVIWSMVRLFNSNKLLLSLLITVTLRISTDQGLFISEYDFVVYYLTFYTFVNSRQFLTDPIRSSNKLRESNSKFISGPRL